MNTGRTKIFYFVWHNLIYFKFSLDSKKVYVSLLGSKGKNKRWDIRKSIETRYSLATRDEGSLLSAYRINPKYKELWVKKKICTALATENLI